MLGHDPTLENYLVVRLYKGLGDLLPGRKQLLAEGARRDLSWREVLDGEAAFCHLD